jgi:Tn3 transposase DDE domain
MLKESAILTGCLDCFQSTGSREALDPELLQKRLLLCMYGMGTNMGLIPSCGPSENFGERFNASLLH